MIDDVMVSVGSFNWDDWSHKKNLELNLMVIDPGIAEEVKKQIAVDLEGCDEVKLDHMKKRSWWMRSIHWAAYMFSRGADRVF